MKKGIRPRNARSIKLAPRRHVGVPPVGFTAYLKGIVFVLNVLLFLGTATLAAYEVSLFIPLQVPVQAETPEGAPTLRRGAASNAASAAAGTTVSSDDRSTCADTIKNTLESERTKFSQFITTHFQSGKPTSELIPTAVERFRQYRATIRDRLDNFLPQGNVTEAQRTGCIAAVTEDFVLMKELLRQHILANAYAKKTTGLMNTYKAINDKLQKLNFTVAQTYGYFSGLAQRVPCYATQCNRQ